MTKWLLRKDKDYAQEQVLEGLDNALQEIRNLLDKGAFSVEIETLDD